MKLNEFLSNHQEVHVRVKVEGVGFVTAWGRVLLFTLDVNVLTRVVKRHTMKKDLNIVEV